MTRTPFLALVPALFVMAVPARALIVGGGGSRTTDCLLVLDVAANSPPAYPHNIRCADGDPCDLDGVVNGSCQFDIAVCANSTADSRCTLNGVQSWTAPNLDLGFL